jgi:pyruvate ferredoxin oxidoreductase alpha subunit
MKRFLEGSLTIAEFVRLCRPEVITAYPITPQTHIVEGLAEMVADGLLDSQMANVESEHSAASVVLGASAAGARTFTATSSQGLMLMAEVLFNIAGLRLPVVLACANRALSAPINIWNDHQDSVSVRDSGFLQFYAENSQEAGDLTLLAFRIGEHQEVSLPVMVCVDGYLLTHNSEIVDVPSEVEVKRFVPPFQPLHKLDVAHPLSLGLLFEPAYYMETRYSIEEAMARALELLPAAEADFQRIFGRALTSRVEAYRCEDAETILVALGSVVGTMKDFVDERRERGERLGVLKIVSYRPFPREDIYRVLRRAKQVAVLEKAVSLGSDGPLVSEVRSVLYDRPERPKVSGFVVGLGGRDIRLSTLEEVMEKLPGPTVTNEYIDLKTEVEVS